MMLSRIIAVALVAAAVATIINAGCAIWQARHCSLAELCR